MNQLQVLNVLILFWLTKISGGEGKLATYPACQGLCECWLDSETVTSMPGEISVDQAAYEIVDGVADMATTVAASLLSLTPSLT